jgi:hypothetical protein
MRIAHADYYRALVDRLCPALRGPTQVAAVAELSLEVSNLRAAARHLVQTGRLDDAGDFAWDLLLYWWISSYWAEVRLWMLELLATDQPITVRTRAIATFFTLWGEMWQRPSDQVVSGLGDCVRMFTECGDEHAAAMALAARASTRLQFPDLDIEQAESELNESVERLHRLGNGWAEAMAEVALGLLNVVRRDIAAALVHFSRAAEIADEGDDAFTRVVAGNNRGRVAFLVGDPEGAEREFFRTLDLSTRLHYVEGAAYGIEGICAVAAARGDAWRAGALSAAATTVREICGLFDVDGFAIHVEPLAAVRQADPEGVTAGERAGAEMTLGEAIRLALTDSDAELQEAVPQW